ncbi:uncharacterized protein EI90DRAFT_1185508 [Cantharellus anzutake]|uniref:uncharacterized protein n=1 Tax=Cantharellus anzutake TaxID=1750568 RepID=UPI0019036541|nr:uncharacterized protein EI90DRAFT_1185508 [Cantharellus anzutake]KAF8330375.1 hypothetical protein EI90DRAFT_1185508 [Cantharellus anzutake]
MTKIIQKSATFLLAVTLAAILVPSVFAHQGSHGINIHQHNRMIKKRISTSGGDVRKRSPDKKKPDVPLLTLTSPGNPTSTDSVSYLHHHALKPV